MLILSAHNLVAPRFYGSFYSMDASIQATGRAEEI